MSATAPLKKEPQLVSRKYTQANTFRFSDAGDKKITVNCVAPGGIKTDMYHAVCREYIPNGASLTDDQVDEYAATWSPLARVGQPIDVARVLCFLASEDGSWINGKVIGIDGHAMM